MYLLGKVKWRMFRARAMLFMVAIIGAVFVFSSCGVEIEVIFNGNKLELEVQPIIINGHLMVPMVDIFEAYEMEVSWDSETQIAIAENEDLAIKLTVNSEEMLVNDRAIDLVIAPQFIDGVVFIPTQAVERSLNAGFRWDHETNTANITPNAVEVPALDRETNTVGIVTIPIRPMDERFSLTISVEEDILRQDTLRQGEFFRFHIELENKSEEDYQIEFDFLFSQWIGLHDGVVGTDMPEPRSSTRFFEGNSTLASRASGRYRFNPVEGPAGPGIYEVRYTASFFIVGEEDMISIRSNTLLITVR